MSTPLPPVDACPSPDCHPGDNPACLPLSHLDLPGGTIAAYWHRSCGTAWATWFDVHLWPIDRSIAPALKDATRTKAV